MPVVIEFADGRRARIDYTSWSSEHATLGDMLTFLFGPGGQYPEVDALSVGNDPEGGRVRLAIELLGGRVVARAAGPDPEAGMFPDA